MLAGAQLSGAGAFFFAMLNPNEGVLRYLRFAFLPPACFFGGMIGSSR